MKILFVAGAEGSTRCFSRFLGAVDAQKADAGVLLGDLTGRQVVPITRKGSSWEFTAEGRTREITSASALAEATAAIEAHGDYWFEESLEELQEMRSNPMMVDLVFKSLMRTRLERWLTLADETINGSGRRVFIAPGCGDWATIDDLLEQSHKLVACDNRVVDLDDYQMLTCSAGDRTDSELAREMDDRQLHERLLDLCRDLRDPEYSILNLQADSRAAQRIVKRFQPLIRVLGSMQGGAGGSRKQGRTLELSLRGCLDEGADVGLRGVLVRLERNAVKDYAYMDV